MKNKEQKKKALANILVMLGGMSKGKLKEMKKKKKPAEEDEEEEC